jgi:hypothetical protein
MKTQPKRICIYPKDVMAITGKSHRQSSRVLQEIRKALSKSMTDFVTINEFCTATGLKREEVEPLIY